MFLSDDILVAFKAVSSLRFYARLFTKKHEKSDCRRPPVCLIPAPASAAVITRMLCCYYRRHNHHAHYHYCRRAAAALAFTGDRTPPPPPPPPLPVKQRDIRMGACITASGSVSEAGVVVVGGGRGGLL